MQYGVWMLPCQLMNGCQNAEKKRVAMKNSMGLLQRTRHAKLLSPQKAAVIPSRAAVPTGQCWGWHLLREGSRPEQAQGAQGTPGWHLLLSSRAVPSAQGAWPPFLGAAQRGTTAQTSRMFSCFVMGRCCLRGVWKDYQF